MSGSERRVGRALTGAAAGMLAVGAAGLGWGLVEAHQFTLRHETVPVLPVGQAPIRVLHLSDLHLTPVQHDKLDWLASLADLEPDLVIDTGDNIAAAQSIAPLLRALGPLLQRSGAFVWGSNDYHAPQFKNPLRYFRGPSKTGAKPRELPWRRLGEGLSSGGWVDLTHRRVRLEVAGRVLELRGTDDGHLRRDRYDRVAGRRPDDVDLAIGVTHAPYLRLLDAMAADGLDLVLAGHTHGGQVCLPTGALITNCDLDRDRVKGLSSHTAGGHTSALHVSAGLGTSPFAPYRFFCRPEASLLTLVARGS